MRNIYPWVGGLSGILLLGGILDGTHFLGEGATFKIFAAMEITCGAAGFGFLIGKIAARSDIKQESP